MYIFQKKRISICGGGGVGGGGSGGKGGEGRASAEFQVIYHLNFTHLSCPGPSRRRNMYTRSEGGGNFFVAHG